MTQTTPATAVLGPGKTGLTIGLRVLNLDGTVYAAFSATGVAETSTAGTYRKAGGVVAPLAGGYIVWGTALVDYAEATVESASANVTYWAGSAIYSDQLLTVADDLDRMIDSGLGGTRFFNATALALIYNQFQALQGVDGDTLETLSDQIDGIGAGGLTAQETANAVHNLAPVGAVADGSIGDKLDGIPATIASTFASFYSTQSTDSTAAGSITRRRGDSWTIVPAALGVLTGYTSLWLTIKSSHEDADSSAILHVKKNASGLLDGMLYLNGAASTSNLASITVTDAATGVVSIVVDEAATKELAPGEYYYDIQALIAGNVSTPDSGSFTVTADVTRSVT